MQIRALVVVGVLLVGASHTEAIASISVSQRPSSYGRTPFDTRSPPQRIVLGNYGTVRASDHSYISGGPFVIVATGGDLEPGHELFFDVVCEPTDPDPFWNA